MVSAHASKAGRRYAYYVEKRHRTPSASGGSASLPLLRLPASEMDAAALQALRKALVDQEMLLRHVGELEPTLVAETLHMARLLAESPKEPTGLPVFVSRIVVGQRIMRLVIDRAVLREALGLAPMSTNGGAAEIEVPLNLRRRGRQLKITVGGMQAPPRPVDATLVVAVAWAFDWFDRLASGAARSIGEISAQDGFDAGYISHLLKLAFLSPEAVNEITSGRQGSSTTAHKLIWEHELPVWW